MWDQVWGRVLYQCFFIDFSLIFGVEFYIPDPTYIKLNPNPGVGIGVEGVEFLVTAPSFLVVAIVVTLNPFTAIHLSHMCVLGAGFLVIFSYFKAISLTLSG